VLLNGANNGFTQQPTNTNTTLTSSIVELNSGLLYRPASIPQPQLNNHAWGDYHKDEEKASILFQSTVKVNKIQASKSDEETFSQHQLLPSAPANITIATNNSIEHTNNKWTLLEEILNVAIDLTIFFWQGSPFISFGLWTFIDTRVRPNNFKIDFCRKL